jgi:WD40 repeat protein
MYHSIFLLTHIALLATLVVRVQVKLQFTILMCYWDIVCECIITVFSHILCKEVKRFKSRLLMNIPTVLQTPVTFDRKDPALHREACAVVCKWLSDHDYTSTLQIFRDEINAHARDSHSIRKSSRSIVKSVEEGNWEAAYTALKKLESLNVPEHSLLLLQLAKQHFLELVDEGDAQRAFTFFLRRIKPLEDTIGKSAFQQLTYLLTCRSVADAAAAYPMFRGWTASSSRAALTQWVASTFDTSHTTAYTLEHRLEHSHDVSFDRLIEQALSYQLLEARHPSLLTPLQGGLRATSLLDPLNLQLPPLQRLWSRRIVGHQVRTCQPYLDVPAIAVGTATGEVLWCTLSADSSIQTETVMTHAGRVWSSAGSSTLLATCGGRSMAVTRIPSRELIRDVPCASEPLDVALSADCSSVLCGTADGSIVLANIGTDALTQPPQVFRFSDVACTSVTMSVSTTTIFAGFRDGSVRVIDAATSIVTRTLLPPIAAQVSSVSLSPSSMLLLVAYKNNTLRVWNVVTGKLEARRYGGYTNQARSFVRATFGSTDHHVLSGSEDGHLCFWHRETSRMSLDASSQQTTNAYHLDAKPVGLQMPSDRLQCHMSMIVDIKFANRILMTCSEDGEVVILGSAISNSNESLQSQGEDCVDSFATALEM